MSHDPLRILYSFPHPVGTSGIGTTAVNQVRGLAAAGADVTLLCTSLHADVPPGVRVVETLRLLGRRIPHRVFLGNPDLALAYHDRLVALAVRRHPRRYDVVHTWPQGALASLRAARRAGIVGSREVPNTHTANAYEQASREAEIVGIELVRGHSHRPDPRRLRLEEREYDAASFLMVPSAHVASTFVARGIPADRLRRHQYGYDPTRFHADGRSEVPSRPFTAAFVGSAEPRKGLHYALEAWERAAPPPGSRLLVAGGFVPGYRERVQRRLALPGVEALGFVDDVPALLRGCDVLLLPSVEEGSALVTYEAQASGAIPLVSEAAGALLPEGVRSSLVHAPRDVDALTEHLRLVAHDDAVRTARRQEVIAWSETITWDHAGQRMLDIYAEALSAAGRARR